MPTQDPRWILRLVVDAIHSDMLLTNGDMPGRRDENPLDSELARLTRAMLPGVKLLISHQSDNVWTRDGSVCRRDVASRWGTNTKAKQ